MLSLSKQRQLGADPKAIQQIEFLRQLKKFNSVNADGTESIFVLKILEKLKEAKQKLPQESIKDEKLRKIKS